MTLRGEQETTATTEEHEEQQLHLVGRPIPRVDGFLKVTGKAKYTRDIQIPTMLFGKVKRSPHPHARITRIDLTNARRMNGVKAAITGRDFPTSEPDDTPPLAREEVLFFGQGVAAVAAVDRQTAERAVDAIEIEYEILPAVFDPELAMSASPPTIIRHPNETCEAPNVSRHIRFNKGDAELAYESCEKIVERRYTTSAETNFQMEPLTFVAEPDLMGGGVTIWSTSSGAHRNQLETARRLGMDPNLVRVRVAFLGGWFGAKDEGHASAICARLALEAGRPVKLEFTREETIIATGVRHPTIIDVKDGISKDGMIIARKVRAVYDGGAYGSPGNKMLRLVMHEITNVYRIPNISADAYRVYTNRVPGTNKRDPVSTQITWAIESQMDTVARELSVDPLQFRLRHALRDGEKGATGEEINGTAHERALQTVADAIGWGSDFERQVGGVWRRGRGLSLNIHAGSAGPAQAIVRVRETGMVEVLVDLVENGAGTFTGITQIVADEFGIRPDKVRLFPLLYGSDTSVSGLAPGASASRQLVNVGNAVLIACREAKERIFLSAAKKLGCDPSELAIQDGRVHSKTSRDRSVRIADLYSQVHVAGSTFAPVMEGGGGFTGESLFVLSDKDVWQSSAAQAVQLLVNTETGHIKVERIVATMDVGRAINPQLVKHQFVGAVAMGLNAALSEELMVSNGVITNANLADYKLTTCRDAPEIEPIIMDVKPYGLGPLGAKSASEGLTQGTAPAVRNAVYDAIGRWIDGIPITPESVLRALDSGW